MCLWEKYSLFNKPPDRYRRQFELQAFRRRYIHPDDDTLKKERITARTLLSAYSTTNLTEHIRRIGILRQLLKATGDVEIEPPFYRDYGYNIEVGDNVWIAGKIGLGSYKDKD